MLLRFPPVPGRVEKRYVSLRLLNIFKCFTDYDMDTWDLKNGDATGGCVFAAQLSLPFPGGKWVAWKK